MKWERKFFKAAAVWLACRADLCGHKVPGSTGDLVLAQIGELDWWSEMWFILAAARAAYLSGER
jgi:hypothetical protein